jgi:hypothetical protein
MKINELKRLVKEIVKSSLTFGHEAEGPRHRTVGYLIACIDGDRRYTDKLMVVYDSLEDLVTVTVTESSPSGGMDSYTSSSVSGGSEQTVPSDPKSVMQAIKQCIANNNYSFKRYGKPTKEFRWNDRKIKGLSTANLATALKIAKGQL